MAEVEPKVLKRIEDLLRRGLDQASSANEREVSLQEALRVVSYVRAGKSLDAGEWRRIIVMCYRSCSRCCEDIRPTTSAYVRAGEYAHTECMDQ